MSSRPAVLTATTVTIAGIITLLVVGKPLLQPLAVAIVIWYIIDALAVSIGNIRIGDRQPFEPFALLLALVLIVLATVGVFDIVGDTVRAVRDSAQSYKENLAGILEKLSGWIGVELAPRIKEYFEQVQLGSVARTIAAAITSIASDAGLVIIYVMFLLIERRYFGVKIAAMFRNTESAERVRSILDDIQTQIRQYLLLKTALSALTGAVSYALLVYLNVDYPAFWAFLIFLLNYIPTIGSLLGVLFPAALALVQFDTLTPFVVLLVGLGGIQFVIGNVLEPRLLGSSLNLSSLVVLLTLALWGQIWGIVGMFLSVPLTVIMMIVFAHFPATRPAAIALSEKGQIETGP